MMRKSTKSFLDFAGYFRIQVYPDNCAGRMFVGYGFRESPRSGESPCKSSFPVRKFDRFWIDVRLASILIEMSNRERPYTVRQLTNSDHKATLALN